VIPTLKTVPFTTGQESNVSNSAQPQENSGVGGDRKAFGDILSSQESGNKGTDHTKVEKSQRDESGNKGHGDGKELPSDSEKGKSAFSATNEPNSNDTHSSSSTVKDTGHSPQSSPDIENSENTKEQAVALLPQATAFFDSEQVPGQAKQPVNDQGAPKVPGVPDVVPQKVTNAIFNDPALTREVGVNSSESVVDSSTRAASSSPMIAQLLGGGVKQPEGNNSSQKIDASALIGDGEFVVKPTTVAGKPDNTSSASNNIVSVDVAKQGASALRQGSLTPDDFAAIQQALEGGAAKEKAIFESLEQLTKLETSSLKSVASSQVGVSTQAPLVAQTANGIPQLLEPGIDSVLKGGSMTMTSSLGEPGWDGEFLGRINILVKGGIQEAKIQLSPPEMGRLEIKVSTEGDSAKIMFAVDSVAAREAIEQAMPRLRELLEQGGLQLSHSEVADYSQSQKEQSQIDEGLVGDNLASEPEEEGEGVETWQLGVTSSSSTVDYYI